MTREDRGIAVAWLGLLALLALQLVLHWVGLGAVVPYVGLLMAGVVAFRFMRLGRASGLSRVFALAGVFWLLILFGLSATDLLSRVTYPGELHAEP